MSTCPHNCHSWLRYLRAHGERLSGVLVFAFGLTAWSHASTDLQYSMTDMTPLGNPTALNARGEVIGRSGSGVLYSHGAIIALGTLGGGGSFPNSISRKGEVTGFSYVTRDTVFHAFISDGTTITDLGTLGGITSVSDGLVINARGQVTGWSSTTEGYANQHAFLYDDVSLIDLGTLGGSTSQGDWINDKGQVTGFANLAGDTAYHAFVSDGATMTDLGTLGGTFSAGTSINNRGEVTGDAYTPDNTAFHAFIYRRGKMKDLGTLAGGTISHGMAINDSGQVTGIAYTAGDNAYHAFISDGTTMTDMGTLGGPSSSPSEVPGGKIINARGEVTGWSTTAGGEQHGFLYRDGVMLDLNTLVVDSTRAASVTLTGGASINDRGWIAANGSDGHGYLLKPLHAKE